MSKKYKIMLVIVLVCLPVISIFYNSFASAFTINDVAKHESGFNPRAVSRSGALGVCQVMPGTWRQFSKRGEKWYNPVDNRAVAERYIAWIKKTLKAWGDPNWNKPSHVLACYNGGISLFRKVGFRPDRMPRETRNYIKKFGYPLS